MESNFTLCYACEENDATIVCQCNQKQLWLDWLPKHIGQNPTVPHLTVPISLKGKIQSAWDVDDMIEYHQKAEAIQKLIRDLRIQVSAYRETRLERLASLGEEIKKIVDDTIARKSAEFVTHADEIDVQLEDLNSQFIKIEEGSFADILIKSSDSVAETIKLELWESDNIEFLLKALDCSLNGKLDIKMIRNLKRPVFNKQIIDPTDEMFYMNPTTQEVVQYSIGTGFLSKQVGPREIFSEGSAYAILETGIFLCGGRQGGHITENTFLYNPVANVADKLPDLNVRRQSHAVARLDHKIFVFGGYSGVNLSSSEEFDIRQMAWNGIPDLPIVEGFPSAVAFNKLVYIVGSNIPSIFTYDPAYRTYSQLSVLLPQGTSKTIGVYINNLMVILPNREYEISTEGTTIKGFNGNFGMNCWNRCPTVCRNSSVFSLFWKGELLRHDFTRPGQAILDFSKQ